MRRSFTSGSLLLALAAVGILGMSGNISLPGLSRGDQVSASTYKAMAVTLKDGSTQTVRWNGCQDGITYKVNLSGVKARNKASTLHTIRGSFRKLSDANGIDYKYAGATSFVPTKTTIADSPAEIVVAAVDPSETDFTFEDHTLGIGGVLWNAWTTQTDGSRVAAVRGYVVLNARGLPKLETGFGPGHTLGNLVQHELGHVMGLEHIESTQNLMNATLTTTSPDGYGIGDQRGLDALGADAECISVPSSALPDLG